MKTKYNVWSLLTVRGIIEWDGGFNRQTGLPAKPERYWSKWNDLKLAWLVFTRKADAIVWEEDTKKLYDN